MNTPIQSTPRLSFNYGDETIPFQRVARQQAQGKVLIKVLPDCRVVVSAPPGNNVAAGFTNSYANFVSNLSILLRANISAVKAITI